VTFTVYGIRLRGDKEIRYVGQTVHTPQHRLLGLRGEHGRLHWTGKFEGSALGHFLHDHKGQVEAFEIARCSTRAEARDTERFTIKLCLSMGHRLFNGDHVPQYLRISRKLAA
jgi:hypothetical protein